MLNNEISNILSAFAVILKSTIMFLIGICSSWVVSALYDSSLILMIIVWMVCELIANSFIRPMIDLALRIKKENSNNQ